MARVAYWSLGTPELYALHPSRQPPLVPAALRLGVPERTSSEGSTLVPLDLVAADAAIRRLFSHGVESIAVCLLFSFLNPNT